MANTTTPFLPATPIDEAPELDGDPSPLEHLNSHHKMDRRISMDRRASIEERHRKVSTVGGSFRERIPSLRRSRPSTASLKKAWSRVTLEFHETGSVLASMGQSMMELPPIKKKLYIITQVLAAISVSLGSMSVGFTSAYTSPALVSMEQPNSTMSVTDDEKSWIGSLMPLSALCGGALGGYLIDALGRKKVLLLCGPPFFVAWILIGAAVNVWMIYVGRAVSGFCVGMLSLSMPVYLSETIQPEIRGTLGLLPTTIGNMGILVCYLLGKYVDWSNLAYGGSVIPVIYTIMVYFIPETPRWSVSKDRIDDAKNSLRWLRGEDWDVEREVLEIEDNYEVTSRQKASFRELTRPIFLRPFLISAGLMLFQQCSGINAVIFYTVSIFESAGSSIDGYLCTIIVGVVNLLSTVLANGLIDRLGRKILLYTSNVLMVVSLISLGVYFYLKRLSADEEVGKEWLELVTSLGWLPLVSFMVYVVAFSLGWGPIPWLFMGEALPARIRGPAASVVTAFNWSCTFIITKNFPSMVSTLGTDGAFFLFAAVMFIAMFFTIFFVPETRGKSLEEIEIEIGGKHRPPSRKPSVNFDLGMGSTNDV